MAYEKPELIALSLAGTAVRSQVQDTGSGESQDGKATSFAEIAGQPVDGSPNPTSSSSGAYEADE